jgi:organic radical activating enzyme
MIESQKPVLPFVETMLTQACNLSCKGCTNFSDLTHKGYVSWSEGKEWLSEWKKCIEIPDFGIMGGEPLINPECKDWLVGVREILPDSQIRFTTNGLLLEKHWDVLDVIQDIGNTVFKITVHVDDKKLENTIQKVFDRYDWEPVYEFGIHRWVTENDIRFQINRPDKFVKTFKNDYPNMSPWHANPVEAFNNCIQQTCPLMYNGRIYKCSTSALIKDTLGRYDFPNWEEWEPYMSEGIHWTSDINDIESFIDNFGKPNKICAQCPSASQTDSIVDHKIHVSVGKIKDC